MRIVNEAPRRPSFLSRSAKAKESGEVDGWHASVLTPVNEGVFAQQYENKDAEVQITYTRMIKMTFWKHDVTGFKFRSHSAKGRQIPWVSVSSTTYVLYDFLHGKVEKSILLENLLIVTSYY